MIITPNENQASVGHYFFNQETHALTIKAPDYFFLVLGQSNAHGQGIIDPVIDTVQPRLYSMGHSEPFTVAQDPLPNHTHISNDKMGFAMSFGKEIVEADVNHNYAVVLCAKSGTSLNGGHWKRGGEQYEDAINAANAMLAMGSVLFGILWHQGESDSTVAGSPVYASNLAELVNHLRTDIYGDNDELPFVVGTLADDWLAGNSTTNPQANRVEVNNALLDIKNNVSFAECAVLSGLSTFDNIHFDAPSLRTIGQRYYAAYMLADVPPSTYGYQEGIKFDGSSKYLLGANAIDFGISGATKFTIHMRIELDMTRTNTAYLFSFYDGTNKIEAVWSNSQFRFNIGTGSNRVYASPDRNYVNYDLCFVYDGSLPESERAKIYVEAVDETAGVVGSIPSVAPTLGTSSNLHVAARYAPPSGVGSYYDEKIQELNIFSDALSPFDVGYLYSGNDPRDILSLVSSYWFGDAPDDSVNLIKDMKGTRDLVAHNLIEGDFV